MAEDKGICIVLIPQALLFLMICGKRRYPELLFDLVLALEQEILGSIG